MINEKINPNKGASDSVLKLLKEGSYERMRVELKCSIELKMKEYNWTWDDLGRLLGEKTRTPRDGPSRGDIAKWRIVQGQITLAELNDIAHIFSCEGYIIFRPRSPWIKT